MATYNTVAFVIRRTNYGEADRILTLYSREYGRFAVIAKGARKAISRMAGATEILNCTRFHLATGKSLDVVTQCEIHDSFLDLRKDLLRLAHALYLVELLDHSVEDRVPHPDLFDLLFTALHLIERTLHPELIARWFEVRLFGELGYAPNLWECAVCGTILDLTDDADEFALSSSMGGALCSVHAHPHRNPDHSGLSGHGLRLLTELTQLGINEGEKLLEMESRSELADDELRIAMRRYRRYRDDRELKSIGFLDSLNHR